MYLVCKKLIGPVVSIINEIIDYVIRGHAQNCHFDCAER
jgi:hypothetical protein